MLRSLIVLALFFLAQLPQPHPLDLELGRDDNLPMLDVLPPEFGDDINTSVPNAVSAAEINRQIDRILASEALEAMVDDAASFALASADDPALGKLAYEMRWRLGLAVSFDDPVFLRKWRADISAASFNEQPSLSGDFEISNTLYEGNLRRYNFFEALRSPHRLDNAGDKKTSLEMVRSNKDFRDLLRRACAADPGDLLAVRAAMTNFLLNDPGVKAEKFAPQDKPKKREIVDTGDMWGYWAADRFFYAGHPERAEGDRYLFKFDDGESAWLTHAEICRVPIEKGMPVQANWQGRGPFYEAEVVSQDGDRIRLRYDDGYSETTTRVRLRLALNYPGIMTVGRRVFAEWEADGFSYPGKIEKVAGEGYFVRFDDNQTAWVVYDQLALLRVWIGFVVDADWQGRGTYYRAEITGIRGDRIQVHYEDGYYEWTSVSRLRTKFKTYKHQRSPGSRGRRSPKESDIAAGVETGATVPEGFTLSRSPDVSRSPNHARSGVNNDSTNRARVRRHRGRRLPCGR